MYSQGHDLTNMILVDSPSFVTTEHQLLFIIHVVNVVITLIGWVSNEYVPITPNLTPLCYLLHNADVTRGSHLPLFSTCTSDITTVLNIHVEYTRVYNNNNNNNNNILLKEFFIFFSVKL